MSDIVDGLGTAAEGGLWARVLEPKSGAKDWRPDEPQHCANCGAELMGAYCHACGQKAHLHRSLTGVVHDVMHGALHLDSKMWRTLPMLLLRPGRLTQRYIEGARARFVSPMALFLFCVFLMFAVFQVLGIGVSSDTAEPDEIAEATEQVAQVAEEAQSGEGQEAFVDGFIEGLTGEVQVQEPTIEDEEKTVLASGENGQATITAEPTGIDWLDKAVSKKWQQNPTLMLYKLQANAYKFSWLLIPISLPFMWLLFVWKRRFKVYDHAIFVTYSLSFMTLLFVVLSLAGKAGLTTGWLLLTFAVIAPLHIYKQLKGAYSLSRFSAIWRLLILCIFIFIILLIFLQALFLLGLF